MPDTVLLRRPGTPTADGPVAASRSSRLSAWVAVVAVIAGLAVSPPWGGTGGLPEGAVGRLVAGVLERQVDGGWSDVAVGELVAEGARVRSSDGARLEVDGGELSLGGGSRATLDALSELEAGSVLVVVPDSERAVRLGAITASGRGAWRVDASETPRVGVYDGGVGLRVAGDTEQALAVRRLEQADLIAGGLPAEPLPLRYSPDDDWDARLLAGVLAIDRQAAQVRSTLAGRFGTVPLAEDFYREFDVVEGALADALPRYAEVDADGRVGPPADVLLGVIVTDLVRRGAALSDAEAVRRVTTMRGAGATWGIVLAVHDLGADALRGAADLTLRGGPAIAPTTVGTEVPGTDEPGPGGGTGPTPTETPTEAEPEPEPSPQPSPSPSESDAAGPCQLEPCEPVNEEVDELTDLLDEISPGTGETVDEIVSEVPTILPPGGLDGDGLTDGGLDLE